MWERSDELVSSRVSDSLKNLFEIKNMDYVDKKLQNHSNGRILSTAPFHMNKSVSYRGHASAVYSVDQAVEFLDIIGLETGSEDYLPFAIVLVDSAGEFVSIAEDNGEFSAGEMLARALQDLDGFNALICVSRHVRGVYVAESAQHMKFQTMKQAATEALSLLYQELVKRANEKKQEEKMKEEINVPMSGSLVGDHSLSLGSEGKMGGGKPRHRGSGPGGRETKFERTERQAIERFQKQMQLEQEKALIAANRPTLAPVKKQLALPKSLKAFRSSNEPKRDSPGGARKSAGKA